MTLPLFLSANDGEKVSVRDGISASELCCTLSRIPVVQVCAVFDLETPETARFHATSGRS